MTYETQLTELAEKMAREQYPEYEKRLRFRQLEYIETMRPLAAIALAFAAEKIKQVTFTDIENVEQYLKHKGLIN
jgi:hypothetical protein